MSSVSGQLRQPELSCDAPTDVDRYVHNLVEVRGHVRGAIRVVVECAGLERDAAIDPEAGDDRGRAFATTITTAGLPRGEHVLTVRAIAESGASVHVERRLDAVPYGHPSHATAENLARGETTLSTGPPDLESGSVLTSPARIGGWCFSTVGVDRVEAFLDGERRYDLVFPLVRRDVWRALGRSEALLSGFQLVLDRAECPPGEHSLVVVATCADGRLVGQARRFICVDPPDDVSRQSRVETTSDVPAPEGLTVRAPAPVALAPILAATQQEWLRWTTSFARGRTVLFLDDGTALDLLGPLRDVATSLTALTLDDDLEGLPAGHFDVVMAASPLALDEPRREQVKRLLTADGVVIAVGDTESFEDLNGRFRHVTRWTQTAQLMTRIVLADETATGRAIIAAGDRPLSPAETTEAVPIAADLAALAEEHALQRLSAIVAERQMIVSALEGDVVARYHRELQRQVAELHAVQRRADALEASLGYLRDSLSWRATAPLRALSQRVTSDASLARVARRWRRGPD